ALAAADVEHRAQRPFQVVLGGGDGQRHLALQAAAPADAAAAVPAVEVGAVVGLLHGRARYRAGRVHAILCAPRHSGESARWTPTSGSSPRTSCWSWPSWPRPSTCRAS